MHWQYSMGAANYCTGDMVVGRIHYTINGTWSWWLLRYSGVQGIEQTQQAAQRALEAAWQKHSGWVAR